MAIKSIFKTGPAPNILTFILVLLAILLMIADQRSTKFQHFRSNLSLVVWPVQQLVNVPVKTVHWIASGVTLRENLLEENAKLRAHQLLLQAKLQKLLSLQRQNAQLRELLASRTKVAGRVSVAQLLAVDLNPNTEQVILNQGSRRHVYVGQPVLDAYGVMGQIIDVGLLTSRLLLITDTHSAIPVRDNRSGVRAIAVGLGHSNQLALINVPDITDINKGDLLVTSGLGLRYPVGYPVGVVSQVQRTPGQRFATIILQPSAHLNRTQQVLLVWPNVKALSKAVHRELHQKGVINDDARAS